MKPRPHLTLVPDLAPTPERKLLSGPPWAWFGLLTATVVAPLARGIADVLSVYEPQGDSAAHRAEVTEAAGRR